MAWVHVDDEHVENVTENYDADGVLADDNVILVEKDGDTEEDEENTTSTPKRTHYEWQPPADAHSRWIAAFLAIFLGTLGLHKFYMIYPKEGAIMLGISILGAVLGFPVITSAVTVIGLVEGIIYIARGKRGFYETYDDNYRGWF